MTSAVLTAAAATWDLLLDPVGHPGALNMAIDAALLETAERFGRTTLRLYRWAPPCLSFGRHEPASRRYDRALIERLGLDVVRRPTGGRAVWHEHEVTYAVAAPLAVFGSLGAAYHVIHRRIAAALRSFGADVAIAPDRPRPSLTAPQRPLPCFATPAGGEVLVAGRKLVGSAQIRRGGAFLQHGSILLDGSQRKVADVSRQPSAADGETTLTAALGRTVGFEEVADAIVSEWGDALTPTAPARPLPPLTARFSSPAWTWRH